MKITAEALDYIEDEKFQGVVDDVLSGNIQEHQETKLW